MTSSRGSNPSYIDDNFLPESMASLGVDFMAIANPDSAHGRRAGRRRGQWRAEAAAGLRQSTSSSLRELSKGYDPSASKGSGVIATDRGPLLFATQPDHRTATARRSAKSFLMTGRLLDSTEVDALSRAHPS